MTIRWLCMLLLCLLPLGTLTVSFPLSSLAEHLYVGENALGDGSTSCTTQQSAAFFNNVANWTSGALKIGPGDTVHLCNTITSTLTVKADGTFGVPITILFEPGAKISQPVCSNVTACFNTNGRSFIVVSGGNGALNGIIESTANGSASAGYANQTASIGLYADSCTSCEFKWLTVQGMYVHAMDITDKALATGALNIGILWSGSNTSIHHSKVSDMRQGVFYRFKGSVAAPEVGSSVHHNQIFHTDHGMTVAGGISWATFDGFDFNDNSVHDYKNWDTQPLCFVSGTLPPCTSGQGAPFSPYHHDGIHVFGSESSHTQNSTHIRIYNNQFKGDCGDIMTAHIYMEGQPLTASSRPSSWTVNGTFDIFNNVLVCESLVNNQLNLNTGSDGRVFNNIIIGPGTGTCAILANLPRVQFGNNVMDGCPTLLTASGTTTFTTVGTDLDYNIYRCNTSVLCFSWFGAFKSSLAAWRTASGGDSHAVETGTASLLLDANKYPTAGSPLIDAGKCLGALAILPLNTDILGNARSGNCSGLWDAGPAEFGAGASSAAPAAPVNLQLLVDADQNIVTVTWQANTEGNLAGYKVYETKVPGVYGVAVDTKTPASAWATMSPLTQSSRRVFTAGQTCWVVTAFNDATIQSVPSSEVCRTMPGLSAKTARQP